ncbi:DUF4114 domain-containing protein [Roseofilum sp. Guam]|uniref:DUF4114 domain-containing protein n=1 Tax=Roseofilum sp. Guam TaxID=2821502 RepID=UPI001B1C0E10|nr:DUF4114 domain-containing protein [Roseofilum sp. Guam]MBP0028202.1 DUF4114 domain-containing protein [Roseofilum sp. Guam]
MSIFKNFFGQNSPKTAKPQFEEGQTFILEPILTPSGLPIDLDGGSEASNTNIEVDLGGEDLDFESAEPSEVEDIPDTDLEEVSEVEETDDTEESNSLEAAIDPETDREIEEELPFFDSLPEPKGAEDSAERLSLDSDGTIEPDGEQQLISAFSANSSEPEEVENPEIDGTAGVEENSEDTVEETDADSDEIAPVLEIAQPNFTFDSGIFTVGETGQVEIDYIFDGGGYKGELAIFSLDGMDEFEPGSEDFIQEASSRALSDSEQGHVVISDADEGARFSGNLGERDQNAGEYLGVKSFNMRSGDTFGVMLVPNKTVAKVFDNPGIGGSGRPLFSMVTANPHEGFHVGQIADVTGDGSTFVMEDIRIDGKTDSDYNDIIFQIRGAKGKAALMDEVLAEGEDWRETELGKGIIEYVKPYVTPDAVDEVAGDLVEDVETLLEFLDNTTEPEADEIVVEENLVEEAITADDGETSEAENSVEPVVEQQESDATEEKPLDQEVTVDKGEASETENSVEPVVEQQESDFTVVEDNSVDEGVTVDEAETSEGENSVEPAVENNSGEEESPVTVAENNPVAEEEASTEVSDTEENQPVEEEEAVVSESTETENEGSSEVLEENAVEEQESVETSEGENTDTEPVELEPTVKEELVVRLATLSETLEEIKSEEPEVSQLQQTITTLTETLTENSEDFSDVQEAVTTRLVNRLEAVTEQWVSGEEEPTVFEFAETEQPLVGVIEESAGEVEAGDESSLSTEEIITEINSNAQPEVITIEDSASENWVQELVEFVDAARESQQPNAVVALNLNLTEVNSQGEVIPRYDITPEERAALTYAQKNNILVLVTAGDNAEEISALGKLSDEFDNVMTVGRAKKASEAIALSKAYDRADDSPVSLALDILADAGSEETASPSQAVAQVTGAVSQVWAANPELNYTQVIDIIKRTATDLSEENWDAQTGSGLLNIAAAIQIAGATEPERYTVKPGRRTITDNFIVEENPEKELPGDPTHPAATLPGIPQTEVDTGGNSIGQATRLLPSPTVDIIDQVSAIDPRDIFQVESHYLEGTEFTVMDGEVSVKYLTPTGQLLGTETLSRGSHTLQVPANATDEVVVSIESANGNPATYMMYGFESQESEPFQIDLEYDSPLSASQQQIIAAAAKNVASLIGKGLPSAVVDGKVIDDINIKISRSDLDGAGGTQARTKIDFMRYGSLLPAQSLVQFDAADIAQLEASGQLFDVVQHEFLHALGFGNLWEAKGLVDYAGTSLARYNGKKAVEEFQNMGGLTDAISLETQGAGSASLHWHEQLFQDEIMTADLNGFEGGDNAPISAVTIASLADLGYEVNLDRATPEYELLGGDGFNTDDLTPEEIEAFRELAETSFEESGDDYIAPIMPVVNPETVSPEIWAHAERFWKNGEYYDWHRYQIKPGDTLSHLAQRYLGNAGYDYYKWIGDRNGVKNYDYIAAWEWIDVPVHHPNYEWKQEQERLRREEELRRQQEDEARKRREEEERLAQEKAEQERKAREEEERRLEAERKQRELEEQERRLREEMERRRQEEERRKEEERLRELERQRQIAEQQGRGGLDWFFSTPLPEFGPTDPFETKLSGETVGNLVPDDYYRFTLSRKGRIDARLMNLLADADLVLYDVRNRPISYSMREGITDEQILVDLIPGTYMLRVNSPKGVTTDYDLIVKFKHQLSRTEQGPPPGWRVGKPGGGGGGTGPLFSDPRIQRIYDQALGDFSAQERAKANQKIAQLKDEKRVYEQEMQALLDQMNAEQKAKVHAALDDARHNANVWVDDIANPIKGTVDSLADGINSKADSVANGLIGTVDGIWDFRNGWIKDRKEDARRLIRQGRDAVKGAVNEARSWLKGQLGGIQDGVKSAVWHFFETIKNAYRTGAEINQVIANAANSFRSAIDNAVRGANELVGKFKGKVLGAVNWTKDLGINIDKFGVKFNFNAYNQIVEPAVNAIAGGVSSAINGMGNTLKGITNWLEPRTQKAVAAIVDALFGDKTGNLWNKINGVDEKIAATRSELERKIVQKANELKNQMQSLLNGLGSEGKKLLDTILKFGNSTGGQVTIELIKVALGFVPVVGQAIDIVDTVLALWKIVVGGRRDVEVWVELLGSLAGWFPGVGDAIKGIAKIALKSPIGALLRKLGPDVTKQAAKIFKQAKWKEILLDVVEGLAGVWRKFDSQMDNAAGWILDLMPGVRPTMAAVGEIIVKFNDEAADAGKHLDDISQQIAKKIDDTSEQIAKEDKKKEDPPLQLPGPVKIKPGSVDDLLVNAKKYPKNDKSIQYDKNGSVEEAWQDYRDLTDGFNPKGTETSNGKLFVAELPDGSKAIGRGFSSGGSPTIEIQKPNGEKIKVRYVDKFDESAYKQYPDSSNVSSDGNNGNNSSENKTLKSPKLVEGNSTDLGNNLNFPTAKIPGKQIEYPGVRGDYQAHHVIPIEVVNDSYLMLNAVHFGKFDIDSSANGIFLPASEKSALNLFEDTDIALPIHLGSHPNYSSKVKEFLDREWQELLRLGKTEDPDALLFSVNRIANWAKKGLVEGYLVNDPTIKWLEKP